MSSNKDPIPPADANLRKSSSLTLAELMKDLKSLPNTPKPTPTVNRIPKTTFDEQIEKEKARVANDKNKAEVDKLVVENENLRNDQSLKSATLKKLFILLFGETLIIFVMSFLQGFHFLGFDLDLITFRVIVVATLIQISTMLTFAVRHLFPVKSNSKN
jgi:hypothetical protein|tara:strand:+ start:1212 stop:1688 length:477 start_codon:yes stop_codon:yes gene_type:complete